MTGRIKISAKRQFFLLSVVFSVVLAVYSGWIIHNQLQTIKIIADLKNDTVPLMIRQLRTARDLDSLRFETDKVINAETQERSSQGLYYVSVHINDLGFQNDAIAGPLVADLTDLLRDFDHSRREAYMLQWAKLSDRLKDAADQMSFEAVALGNESIDSVEMDLSESMASSVLMLLLGISFQLLTLFCAGIIFIDPLKKLGRHLKHLDDDSFDRSIDLKSRTLEINSIEQAINRLGRTLAENRLMNKTLQKNEIIMRREMALAEEAARAKSDFISNMSHEIRTPLSTIAGMVYLLEKSGLTTTQLRRIELVKQCSAHLNELMTQVLDLSKIESHMLVLEQREFNFNELLNECKLIFSVEAADKHLAYDIDVSPALTQLTCLGDPLRIKEIVINLLSNAIKFTPTGAVNLRASILEHRMDDHVHVRIAVTDTGIGLTDAQIGQLFQNFSQADSSIRRRFGGSGLGLSISQKLAQLMSGGIRASSVPGKGSVFECTLWLALAAGVHARGSHVAGAPMAPPGTAELALPLPCVPHHSAMSPADVCNQLACLARGDDPAALSLLDAHSTTLASVLGDALAALQKALSHYRLPEAAALLAQAGYAPAPALAAPPDDRPLLLLVDDTPSNLTYLSGLFQDVCRLRVATTGQRAIELAGSHPPPRLVLMDVAMPDMDGFSTLNAMKAQTRTRDVPVMLISASANAQVRERSLQSGAMALVDRITPPSLLRSTVLSAMNA